MAEHMVFLHCIFCITRVFYDNHFLVGYYIYKFYSPSLKNKVDKIMGEKLPYWGSFILQWVLSEFSLL